MKYVHITSFYIYLSDKCVYLIFHNWAIRPRCVFVLNIIYYTTVFVPFGSQLSTNRGLFPYTLL